MKLTKNAKQLSLGEKTWIRAIVSTKQATEATGLLAHRRHPEVAVQPDNIPQGKAYFFVGAFLDAIHNEGNRLLAEERSAEHALYTKDFIKNYKSVVPLLMMPLLFSGTAAFAFYKAMSTDTTTPEGKQIAMNYSILSIILGAFYTFVSLPIAIVCCTNSAKKATYRTVGIDESMVDGVNKLMGILGHIIPEEVDRVQNLNASPSSDEYKGKLMEIVSMADGERKQFARAKQNADKCNRSAMFQFQPRITTEKLGEICDDLLGIESKSASLNISMV